MKTPDKHVALRLSGEPRFIEALESRIAPAALIFADQDASGYDTRTPVAVDDSGNVFVAGVFDGTITLGSGPSAITLQTQELAGPGEYIGSDLYVAKYAPDGRLLWASSWGGVPFAGATGPQEIIEDIVLSLDGDVFVLTTFQTQDAGFGGNGGISATGGPLADTAVLKFFGTNGTPDPGFGNSGVVQWGGTGRDTGGAISRIHGDIVFCGAYDSPSPRLNGNTGYVTANGGSDAYVIRISANDGTSVNGFGTLGMVNFPSLGNEVAFDLAADETGVFVALKDGIGTRVAKLNPTNGTPSSAFGVGGILGVPNLAAIALDPGGRLLATGGIQNPGGYLKRFLPVNGVPDVAFNGTGTVDLGANAQIGLSIATDNFGAVYVAGVKGANPTVKSQYFIAKYDASGAPDTLFGTNGRLLFATTGNDSQRDISIATSINDTQLRIRGLFSGTTDIDPTKGKLTVTATTPSPNAGHADLDTFLLSLDPNGVDASNPFTLTDQSGDTVRIVFKGAGRLSVTPGTTPGVDIERIEAFDTDTTTKLSINVAGTGSTVVAHIITPGVNQHLGMLKLGKTVILGSGSASLDPALRITGSSTKLLLSDVNANAVIKLGQDLPYDITGDDTTPDTYNHAPSIKMRDVLGANVVIDVTGDGLPGGTGGGGLGKVLVNSWTGAGLIKTTQSISAFRQTNGDCYVVFEVDKFNLGSSTRADMGSITIPNGAWGSSGSEIEGNCGSFSCSDFLAGATISAGNINKFLVKNGSYAGTVTLKDPSAGSMGTFKVNSDFTGYVDSLNSIINIKVSGDFKGSLVAASIGSIQAFSFDGATTGDLYKDATRHQIIAQSGSLGTLKTKGGGIANFEIEALTVLGGISVSTGGSGTSSDLTALHNITVIGAEIGDTDISLKPSTGVGTITLIAMHNVIYDMESSIGKITASHRIQYSQLSAGTHIDKITVGSNSFPAEGISNSYFLAGSNLGGDGLINGNETWKRNGTIASITVAGAVTKSTFSAGINPMDGIFGNIDDALGTGGAPSTDSIGSIKIGPGSGTATGSPALPHDWVIQGETLKDLKINGTKINLTNLPKYLRITGAEATSDILVRKI